MNAELNKMNQTVVFQASIPDAVIDRIADRVIDKLKIVTASSDANGGDELLTVLETAQFLKVSEDQIYQWVNRATHKIGDKPIPHMKAGRCLRFSKNSLKQWMTIK